MINTKVIEEPIPAYDSAINQFLSDGYFNGGGTKMTIGVENQNLKIYRLIETTGFGDFMEVLEFLSELGLTDILEKKHKPVKGYDAIFRPEDISALSH